MFCFPAPCQLQPWQRTALWAGGRGSAGPEVSLTAASPPSRASDQWYRPGPGALAGLQRAEALLPFKEPLGAGSRIRRLETGISIHV